MADLWTLARVFRRSVQEHLDATMLVAGGSRLTYGQVGVRSSGLAVAMSEMGFEAGDRVAIILPNRPEWIVGLLACAKLGATIVPVNPRLNYHELSYQLRHAEVCAAFTAERYDDIDFRQVRRGRHRRASRPAVPGHRGRRGALVRRPDLRVRRSGVERGRASGSRAVVGRRRRGPGAVVHLRNGGKPKGVRLSHRAVVETAVRTGEAIAMGSADRVLVALPLFTIFGFGVAVGTMAAGAALVLQEEFHTRDVFRLLEAERVTVMHRVPTMFQLLMREPTFDPNHLRWPCTGIVAGGSVSAELVHRVREWRDVEVAYGLTEMGPTVAVTRPDDPPDKRAATGGHPLPGVGVGVADCITGALHGPEAVGEIAVRGPNVMPGAVRMPAETRRSFTPEGYFLTGDLGIIDKVPDLVRFIDAFPMTGSGTVRRRELERVIALDHTAIIGSS